MLIPREGGHLVRMYVDLGKVGDDDNGRVRRTSVEDIIRTAAEIIHPYSLDVRHVAWHSVYEVGHRVTDRFDDVPAELLGRRTPRVFIAGDACHTHSAKAGQGMNVSMQDGFNLAWKIAHVLEGLSLESLLSTYSAERRVVAQDLIDFDRKWSSIMAKRPDDSTDDSEIEDFYTKTAEFPAGFMTQYGASMAVGDSHYQHLAKGFPIGRRFKSSTVVRVADALPLHLGHHHRADGRWRIYAFSDRCDGHETRVETPQLNEFGRWAEADDNSPVRLYTPDGRATDAVFDIKVVYQLDRSELELSDVPSIFMPRVGVYDMIDYHKVYAVDRTADIFDERAVDRAGAIVVVRPDQYVAAVVPLDAFDELSAFFAGVMVARQEAKTVS